MAKQYYLFLLMASCLSATAQIIDFPDPVFKARLLTSNPNVSPVAFDQNHNYVLIDANADGEITQQEALAVYEMRINAGDITDLTGIEYFVNLENLQADDTLLTTVDVSMLSNLKVLACSMSPITTLLLNDQLEELTCAMDDLEVLDVSHCPNLRRLWCNYNDIAQLNVAGLSMLESINCSNNAISVLDVSNMPNLAGLICANNNISELDVAGKAFLSELDFSHNQLSSIDLTGVGSGVYPNTWFFLSADYNNLSSIDITAMEIDYVICDVSYNPNLTSIFAYNEIEFFDAIWQEPPLPGPSLFFAGTPNLEYICVYPMNIEYVEQKVAGYAYTGVIVNSMRGENLHADNLQSQNIKVYPNPASNVLFIEGQPFESASVYNMLGQCVLAFKGHLNGLDVSSLVAENYLLRLSDDDNSATVKFFKQ